MGSISEKEEQILKRLAVLGLHLTPAEVQEMQQQRQQWQESTSYVQRERLRLLQAFSDIGDHDRHAAN